MTINYELLFPRLARTKDCAELAMPDTLEVRFSSPSYDLAELVVNVRNGKVHDQIKVRGAALDLSPFLFAGKIEMKIFLISKGKPVKEWDAVPLIITEIDKGFLAIDEITELQKRVSELEKKTTVIL